MEAGAGVLDELLSAGRDPFLNVFEREHTNISEQRPAGPSGPDRPTFRRFRFRIY